MFKKQFNLNIWDYSYIPYCVVELILDENRQPIDWIYRYCNQAFADIKGYQLNAMIDHSMLTFYVKFVSLIKSKLSTNVLSISI